MISQINPNAKYSIYDVDSLYEMCRTATNIEIVMHILNKICFQEWCTSMLSIVTVAYRNKIR